MKNDLLIMGRVLLIVLFVLVTFKYPIVFVSTFWMLVFIFVIVGLQEAKAKSNVKTFNFKDYDDYDHYDVNDDYVPSKTNGTPFDENLYRDEVTISNTGKVIHMTPNDDKI